MLLLRAIILLALMNVPCRLRFPICCTVYYCPNLLLSNVFLLVAISYLLSSVLPNKFCTIVLHAAILFAAICGCPADGNSRWVSNRLNNYRWDRNRKDRSRPQSKQDCKKP